MQAVRTLQPGDRISRYRIIGPLGAGGMGEVYLAQDQSLERSVALKILPPELIRNEDRTRRFVLEAKSASSLNHPNIVTIYEIGQDEVQSSEGGSSPSSPSPVHFISMELISGETLSTKIHHENTDLRTLVGYLAQAAEGIAKAHAAGIVHRDLKPGNIMVSKDGFAKVLDFGLAKLTEKRDTDPDVTSVSTMTEMTSAGVVLGTAGYMSPEQVVGKPVDARSDIFSFGCILYEAATRQKPFAADTSVETMHKILNERATPVEDLNPKVPHELRRTIRRCLAKSPDQRLQSMKDIALDLREIFDEYDALSASASSGSGRTQTGVAPAHAKPRPRVPVLALAGLVALAGIALSVWGLRNSRKPATSGPSTKMRVSAQTNRGDVSECAISVDGRYLAYATEKTGRFGLHVRQIATGSDVEVLAPMESRLSGLTFSPDGNYLYFLGPKADAPRYQALYQVPSLGGQPQERAYDVDTRVAFSPNGGKICFVRGAPQTSADLLIVRELDSGQEQTLGTLQNAGRDWTAPSWSPDGRRVAVGMVLMAPTLHSVVALFRVADRQRDELAVLPMYVIESLSWLTDGSAIAISGIEAGGGFSNQVSLVAYPGGQVHRITNDVSDYSGLSASSGNEALALVRRTHLHNLWVADATGSGSRAVTSFTNAENSVAEFAVADSGTLLYTSSQDGGFPVFALPVQGGEPRRLTRGEGTAYSLRGFPGGAVFGWLEASGAGHVWRVNADGTGLKQLTQGKGGSERPVDASSDGRFASYQVADGPSGDVMIVPLDGGAPYRLTSGDATGGIRSGGDFSRDGSRVGLFENAEIGGTVRTIVHVVPAAGGDAIARDTVAVQAGSTRWGPDGESYGYVLLSDSFRNVARKPIGRGSPVQVTRFAEGQVFGFSWSPDGRKLALVREVAGVQNVWVTDADGSHPVQVTQFTTEKIDQHLWLPDSRRVAVIAGPRSADAVLVRDFR
jgi:eukaryotic-like serine/threonine-protein kinase